MSNHLLTRHKRGLVTAAALCTALALTACGGSSSDDPQTPPAQPPVGGTPTPPALPIASDSFFAYVMARVGTLLDNAEPESIDAVVATKPDSTEPEPVK